MERVDTLPRNAILILKEMKKQLRDCIDSPEEGPQRSLEIKMTGDSLTVCHDFSDDK